MNYHKKIVCLAASRKPGGQCVAGKEVTAQGHGSWVRPVSIRPSAEIQLSERRFEDGTEPKLLDIINIPMLAPVPRLHQTENHMIDAGFYWQNAGTFAWGELASLEDSPPTLWTNNDASTYHGCHDRVSDTTVGALRDSLLLIKPDHATVEVLTPGASFGDMKRAVRVDFYYKGVRYNFRMTDPVAETTFYARPNGTYQIDREAYFCISLAESPYEGYCYKLVASIITEERL